MVVYGQCEQQWAKQQVRVCRQLLLKKQQRAPVCAVYLGPPDEKPSLGIRLPNVTHVSHGDLSAIFNFVLMVQAKAATPKFEVKRHGASGHSNDCMVIPQAAILPQILQVLLKGGRFMTTPSPYPGLRPFHQDEADLFFGREAQVEDMLARLEAHRFLAVVGTSGCGKSSLVRAGLIPALEQGFLSDAKPYWRIAIMHPGNAPFDTLTTALLSEAALGPERQRTTEAAPLLQATLRRGPLGLVEALGDFRERSYCVRVGMLR